MQSTFLALSHPIIVCVFTCATDAGAAVYNHRRTPWGARPTGAQTLDCSITPLKYMLTEVQHGRSTLGHPKVWPADIEVVAHISSLTRLRIKRKYYYTLSFELA